MVLEQLYPISWLEQKSMYGFVLGVSYSVLGIFSAMAIFPKNPAMVSIAFTSLLLLPSLNRLLAIEETQGAREKHFSLKGLFRMHSDIVKVYFFIFIGVMLTFAFFTLMLPQISASFLFSQQAQVLSRATGQAIDFAPLFEILLNNLWVLMVVLIASFIYGAGSIFILTWNASAWGVVFGMMAKHAATMTNVNPVTYFLIMLVAVLPHLVTEAGSYFLATVAGGIISKATIREKFMSPKFKAIIKDGFAMFTIAIIVLIIAALLEVYVGTKLFEIFNL